MHQLTLELLGQLLLGTLAWAAIMAVILVPARRAFVVDLVHRGVNRLRERSPIVALRYVDTADEQADDTGDTAYQVSPDIYQAEPAGTNTPHTSMIPADREALVRHLADLRYPNGLHCLSANAVYAAVQGNRNEVMALIREVRPKAASDEPYQFRKVGEREQYERLDVKPMR